METSKQIAKHFREIHFGGNWTVSNVRDQLSDVNWKEAIEQVEPLNTIATLSFHISYFVSAVLQVLEGGPLDAHDKYSFDHPPINSQEDWDNFVKTFLDKAERCAQLIEKLPEERWTEDFTDPKYGTYYRNFHGLIEHSHYHLGQISLIKKLIQKK